MLYTILIILIIILFFPIKIKLTTVYENQMIRVFFFSKEMNLKKKATEEKTNVRNAKKARRTLKKFLPKDLKKVIRRLSNNNFKPGLKLKFQFNYGFEDAAATGICYGLFNGLNGVVYELFGTTFKIKEYEFNIIPHFNDPMLNFRITSIFSFNLAKIIYMLIIIYA